MTEWFYRATTKRISFEDTRDLAEKWGFLCRSAFKRNGAHIPNVRKVKMGDIIHLYYRQDGGYRPIGSFVVVDDRRYGADLVAGTSLQKVTHSALDKHLRSLGAEKHDGEEYKPDPTLERFTGWRIELLPKANRPKFNDRGSQHSIISVDPIIETSKP